VAERRILQTGSVWFDWPLIIIRINSMDPKCFLRS
jgi:hypothetical protein